MKIFLDTANCDEIKALLPTGMVDGVTTNPSLIAKSGRDIKQTIAEICTLVDGPVSAEVTAIELSGMRGSKSAVWVRQKCDYKSAFDN